MRLFTAFNRILHWPLLLVLAFSANLLFAQSKKIEALSTSIKQAKSQQKKADLHSELAERLYNYDLEKGFVQAKKALNIAVENRYNLGQAQALTSIGNYYFYIGDNNKSLQYYNKALSFSANKGISGYPAKTFLRLAILYRYQAVFDSSRYYLQKTSELITNPNNESLRASMYASDGLLHIALYKNESALVLLKKSLTIRLRLRDSVAIGNTYRHIGVAFLGLSEYDSADFYYDKTEKWIDENSNSESSILLNLSRGETEYAKGDFDKAILYYTSALNSIKQNAYNRFSAIILYRMGELYEGLGAYQTAYDYLFASLKEFEKTNARQNIALAYSQIGWCYNYQENYSLAIENANNALKIAYQIGDSASIAQNQNLLGFSYYKLKKYDQALVAFNQALIIRTNIKFWWGVSYTLYNSALVYKELGETEKALGYLYKALEIDERIGKKAGVVNTCNELGLIYTQKGDFKKAAFYLDKAGVLAKKIPMPPQVLLNFKNHIFLYEKEKKEAKVIEYYKLYIDLQDSLAKEINSDKMSNADALFQLQKKATEVDLIRKESELQQERIRMQELEISWQKTIIIAVSIGLLVLFVFIVFVSKLLRDNQKSKRELSVQNNEIENQKAILVKQSKDLSFSNIELQTLNNELEEKNHEIETQADNIIVTNKKLAELNDGLERRVEERTSQLNKAYNELETFFYRTSHDFRSPLTTYLGLVEIAKATIKDKQALELFDKVKETTINLDRMLIKLQSVANVDYSSGLTEIDIPLLITQCCKKYTPDFRKKKIELITNIEVKKITSNSSLLKTVLENIIENAINFSDSEHPYLKINVMQADDLISIEVEDNGQGIPEKLQSKVFEMYYRGNQNSQGNGLGLYVAKRASEKMGGVISFKSTQDKGTIFVIQIPRS